MTTVSNTAYAQSRKRGLHNRGFFTFRDFEEMEGDLETLEQNLADPNYYLDRWEE